MVGAVRRRATHEHATEHWERLDRLDQDVVLSDPGPELMFDDRIYKRGALFLHALRLTVGDDAFFDLLSSWVEQHAYGSVTTEMFVDFLRDRTGQDLDELVEDWLFKTALPALPAPS